MSKRYLLLLLASLFWLAACGGSEPDPTPTSTAATRQPGSIAAATGLASVTSLTIAPENDTSIKVVVKGNLPDNCTVIDETTVQQSGTNFLVAITTLQTADLECTPSIVPFEQTVPLDISALAPDTYAVDVNGSMATFTIQVPPTAEPTAAPTETPAPTPTVPAGDGAGSISGQVIHDICALGENGEIGDGCIELADGGHAADGVLRPTEPGLEGVVVDLGAGECPATGLASTVTDSQGRYEFAELPAGVYCVSVAVEAGKNELLIPGGWTAPERDNGNVSITLFNNETIDAVNFGWDYQFLPLLSANPDDCRNALFFVEDLTFPDDTAVRPGEIFVKRWRLQNSGTCIWTNEYQIVFVSGDQMGSETSYPLPEMVPAGEFVDIALTLVAPLEEGTYRTDYSLANAASVAFGGSDSDTFWVQIVVDESATPPEPNSAIISGGVWADDDGDGSFDSFEDPIEGVEVRLSNQLCPADGIINADFVVATVTTDEEGRYSFADLPADSYCVSIAPFGPTNVNILIPGDWSYPAQGVGLISIIVDDGDEREDVDFGWLYQ